MLHSSLLTNSGSRSLRYSNYLAIVLAGSMFIALFILFYSIDPEYFQSILVVTSLFFPIGLVSAFINHRRNYFTCGLIINLSLTILFFIITGIFFGRSSGLHYYFLLFSIVPLFSLKSERKILMAILMVLNICCFIYVDFLKPTEEFVLIFPESMVEASHAVTVTVLFLVMCLIVVINQYVLRSNEKELKRQSDEISRKNEEMANLIHSKDRFFSIIAHDLKGPVGTLSSFLDYLADSSNELSEVQFHESLEVLKRSSREIYTLLDNLLTWSRIQSGNIVFNKQKHNLTELIASTITLFDPQIKQKRIKLVNNTKNQELMILFDKEMIETVLRNLINNAVKFTKEEGEISVSVNKRNSYLELTVADNGVGMDKDTLANLFRIEVKQNSHIGTHGERGTGLGLILCKQFIEWHRGKVNIDSKPGRGSKFTITLPLS